MRNPRVSLVLSCLVVLALTAILIVAPVTRGMFFREDYLPFFVKVSWLFIGLAVILVIEAKSAWEVMPDAFLLAVCGLYGLTILWAKSKGAAIEGALKYCVYLGVFLSARYASRDRSGNRFLRWTIAGSGVVAAMVGILAAAGLIVYKDAVVGGRIFGSFQYPNALAAYEMFVSFVLLHGWLEVDDLHLPWARWTGRILFALSGFTVLLVIVLSYSRATWIVFAAALAGYFAMLPSTVRSGIFMRFMTALVPVLAVNVQLAGTIPQGEHALVQKYLLTGAAICVVLEVARAYLTSLAGSTVQSNTHSPGPAPEGSSATVRRNGNSKDSGTQPGMRSRLSRIPAALALVLLVAVVLGSASEAGRKALSKVVPETIIRRFQSIKLTDRSLLARYFATRDAFLIAKDHPLGTGAGGWNVLYHKYQTTLYWFSETHNHFAQVLVETGFTGLAVYAAFWLCVFYMAFKAWRFCRTQTVPGHGADGYTALGAEVVASAFAVLSLVVHSSADFDLSIPAITIALFAATGSLLASCHAALSIGRGKQMRERKMEVAGSRYIADALSLVILAVVVIVPANKFYQGIVYGSAGVQAIVQGDERQGMDYMHEAMKYDPHTSSYAFDIARIFAREYAETGDKGAAGMAELYLDATREMDPHSINDRAAESQILMAVGLYDRAAEVSYEILDMIPLDIRMYEHMAQTTRYAMISRGVSALSAGTDEKQRHTHIEATAKYAGWIEEIPERLLERQAKVTGLYAEMWSPKRLDITQTIALALGQTYFLEGNREAAVENLSLAGSKPDLSSEANTWLQAVAIATKTEVPLSQGARVDENAAQVLASMFGLLSR